MKQKGKKISWKQINKARMKNEIESRQNGKKTLVRDG